MAIAFTVCAIGFIMIDEALMVPFGDVPCYIGFSSLAFISALINGATRNYPNVPPGNS